MLLAVIGVGVIQNGTLANAATDYQKINDNDINIKYNGAWKYATEAGKYLMYNNDDTISYNTGDTITFNFTGSKLLIGAYFNSDNSGISVIVDGIYIGEYKATLPLITSGVVFEKTDFINKEHYVKLTLLDKTVVNSNVTRFCLDYIGIDSTGKLKPYDNNPPVVISTIILNKTTDNLQVEQADNLVPTTTPAGAEVVWTSSDSSIATVDSTGKVTAVKEGQVTITAQIKGSETKATCTVTVTKNGTIEPTNPTEPTTGYANLFIELVDGNIKSYNVSSTEITKFKQWYLDRDNTTSNKPYYEFSKGDYKDYVIHDKIDWFEVR